MMYNVPTPDNKRKHWESFKVTFGYRRKLIKENMTITDILQKFPRMQDIPDLVRYKKVFGLNCTIINNTQELF